MDEDFENDSDQIAKTEEAIGRWLEVINSNSKASRKILFKMDPMVAQFIADLLNGYAVMQYKFSTLIALSACNSIILNRATNGISGLNVGGLQYRDSLTEFISSRSEFPEEFSDFFDLIETVTEYIDSVNETISTVQSLIEFTTSSYTNSEMTKNAVTNDYREALTHFISKFGEESEINDSDLSYSPDDFMEAINLWNKNGQNK